MKDGKKVEFINSMEAKNYPIMLLMFHPEYQTLDFPGPMKWQLAAMHDSALKPVTDEIAFRVSLRLNREARKNNNKPKGSEYDFMHKWQVSLIPA